MNVSLNKKDAVSGIIKIEIESADYAEQVKKTLRKYSQQASVPGFRKGKLPIQMAKKMFGKSVLAEEINRLVSNELFNYIRENKLNVLGEPLPNETEQQPIDFDTQENFEFFFDIALAPEIDIKLDKRNRMPYYKINITEEMIDKQVEAYRRSNGEYKEQDQSNAEDLLKGRLVELDGDTPKEGGLVVEDAVLMPSYLKNEEERNKLVGVSKNSVILFNPFKACEGSEVEMASLLKIEKEDVQNHQGDFNLELTEIVRHVPAELNQELFDKVFEKGTVNSEEAFRAEIKKMFEHQLEQDSNYKFLLDSRDFLMKKAGELNYSEELLKRWLMVNDPKKTQEEVDAEYPKMIEDLNYHLIKESLMKDAELKVEQEDLLALAKEVTKMQFAQYGMNTVPEDVIERYAGEMLSKEETYENLMNRAKDDKFGAWLREQITLDSKEVSLEEFQALFDSEKESEK